MSVIFKRSQKINGVEYPAGILVVGGGNRFENRAMEGGGAVKGDNIGLVTQDAVTKKLYGVDGELTAPGGVVLNAVAKAVTLHDNPSTPATRGTLITDWSSGYTGAANTLDSSPVVGGTMAQLSNGNTTAYAAANSGAQSSAMKQVGFWAMASARVGQVAAAFYVEFSTDNTFANNCFFAASVPCDGKWHFLSSPAQVAWGTGGTFTIGVTNFTHVRLRESASLNTATGRTAIASGDRVVLGPMYRDPAARSFGYVRLDDNTVDQYVARQTLAADFVGRSGVTIPAGVPQSALSVCQAFGLKANCFILTRHVGLDGFLTVAQLRDLQDTYGWLIGFQTHINPLSADNLGLRLLGNLGYTRMPIGGISAVNAGTGVITSVANHNITITSGAAGNQGFPVTLIGQDFPVPATGAALNVGDTLWLRNVAGTTFKTYRAEADSCNDVNALTFSSAGTPANWGYRYRGSAPDSSAIAADFATGQALMQGWGLNGWRHYAPNQGAFGIETESVLLSMRAAGNLLTASGTYASSGVTKVDYTPRLVHAWLGCGPGAGTGGQFGTGLSQWMTVPSNIDTHAAGVDAEAAIRAYVDDCVSRGAICGDYHHMFSTQASLRNFCVYCDQLRLRVDQGVMETGTMDDLYNALLAARVA